MARWLGVDAPLVARRRYPLEFNQNGDFKIKSGLVEIPIPQDSPAIGRRIVGLSLPRGALIVLIGRDDELVVPNGGTVIQAGDTLLLMADKRTRAGVRAIVGSPHQTEPAPIKSSVSDSDGH